MNTIKGLVEKRYDNDRFPKTSLVVDGVKYGDYDGSKTAGIAQGDMVEITFKVSGQYKNISKRVVKVEHTGATPSTAPIKSSAPAGKLPISLARDRAIIRQNALTAAVNYSTPEATPEAVVEVARVFENYTSGDELEDAVNELNGGQ